ncbi:hypothetical protein SAMN04488034_101808 [Salinimicrobium catena]|uniref:Uncharacterized protein n=1 Tax=Salinimicrobium catena TaxID=390640 RepID=A0A1H5JPL7_9FLAO|nr:hypothetical protein [Salinimicrobium catena]SDK89090.1 hypothetical protein SAMN04488140_101794 [Salinimicrobium catena]SEE54364.1 hypothetical protein SAMN04488034_101808 [Salinimicrobium catena]
MKKISFRPENKSLLQKITSVNWWILKSPRLIFITVITGLAILALWFEWKYSFLQHLF